MANLSGKCLCGSVRYTCNAEPTITAVCHCTHCQKQTGSEYSVIVCVPTDSVIIEGDSLNTYEDTGSSGESVNWVVRFRKENNEISQQPTYWLNVASAAIKLYPSTVCLAGVTSGLGTGVHPLPVILTIGKSKFWCN